MSFSEPVIMISIVDQKGKGFALGAAAYLMKPGHKGALLHTLAVFRSPTHSQAVQRTLEMRGGGSWTS